MEVLQTSALPLGYGAKRKGAMDGFRPDRPPRAGNGTRTRDPNLGKVVLYQLSYSRTRPKGPREPTRASLGDSLALHPGHRFQARNGSRECQGGLDGGPRPNRAFPCPIKVIRHRAQWPAAHAVPTVHSPVPSRWTSPGTESWLRVRPGLASGTSGADFEFLFGCPPARPPVTPLHPSRPVCKGESGQRCPNPLLSLPLSWPWVLGVIMTPKSGSYIRA
jgi:hypothetical protein